MLYALMGLGLSLITGILNIPNFAHGALFAIGAYLLVTVAGVLGNFWVALLVAPLGVALIGLLIEYAGIRRLYAAGHDYQLLFTFGLALILSEGIIVIWGPVGFSHLPPPILRGGVDLGFTFYPKYRLFVMVVAGLLVAATWLFLEKTRYGAIMRAGIENKEMVSLLGIDIHKLFTAAFAIGAYLAGIAGALTAPIRGINPNMGVDMLGIAFVVVALGGLGNLLGAIAAGLLIGIAQAVVAAYWTEASTAVIFAVMALVLLVRPQGCSGSDEESSRFTSCSDSGAALHRAPGDRDRNLDLRDLRAGPEPAARLYRPALLRPVDVLRLGGVRRRLAPQALRYQRVLRARHRRGRGRALGARCRLPLRAALRAVLHHADVRAEP